MQITSSSISLLKKLNKVLSQLTDEQYQSSLDVFSGATLGQHVRHIVEFYACLLNDDKVICYDDRVRELILEESIESVTHRIEDMNLKLAGITADQEVILKATIGAEDEGDYKSSLSRELLYAYEHAIHHMAIIKIGLILNYPFVELPDNFGVAESTVRYKESQCAQ